MKKILVASAAIALLGGPAAFAQQDQSGHHWNGQGGQGQGGQGSQSGQGQSRGGQGSQSQGNQGGQRGPTSSGGAAQSGRPDWNAYLNNNADLQRAYKQNQRSPTYTETPQAFAERHYREHGQAEHRALPMQSYSQQSGGGQQQWNGNRGNGGGQYQGNGQNRWNGSQSQWNQRNS